MFAGFYDVTKAGGFPIVPIVPLLAPFPAKLALALFEGALDPMTPASCAFLLISFEIVSVTPFFIVLIVDILSFFVLSLSSFLAAFAPSFPYTLAAFRLPLTDVRVSTSTLSLLMVFSPSTKNDSSSY